MTIRSFKTWEPLRLRSSLGQVKTLSGFSGLDDFMKFFPVDFAIFSICSGHGAFLNPKSLENPAAKIILKHSKLSKKVGVPCEFRCSWCSCSNLIQFVLWFVRLWRWHWSLGASWSSQGYWGFPHWMILGILGPLGSIIKKSSTNFLEISGNANKSLCEATLLGLSGCSGHWIKWNPFSNTIAQPRQWHQSPNFLYHHHHQQ